MGRAPDGQQGFFFAYLCLRCGADFQAGGFIRFQCGKECHIYYFGDYDPSGKDIGRDIRAKLLDYAPEAEVAFHEVAVLPHQIEEWSLSSRPTKKKDSRAKGWKGDSVELDSIDPKILRRLVTDSIVTCIDHELLESEKKIGELEKETLSQYLKAFL